jgi:endo-alpha-1,4-polygalactosaminidase (GH114 family)
MTNVLNALKMLKDADYKALSIHDHTVVAIDPVQCSSGQRKWTEEREVPMNVANGLERVAHFISERE